MERYPYSKQYAEAQLISNRKCLISFPNYQGVLAPDIEEFEGFLKKYYPESELLIKAPVTVPVPILEPVSVPIKPCIKAKKKKISAAIKKLVWNTNIGEDIGKSKCMCCKSTDITQMSFNCGHIVAEAKGGDTIVSNLKPICQNCNSSMGTTNMNEFMKSLK
jgi:hypothetical protein